SSTTPSCVASTPTPGRAPAASESTPGSSGSSWTAATDPKLERALDVHEDRHPERNPAVDEGRVRDGDADAAVARRVGRHRGVAVDRVSADEVVRVDHSMGVRPRGLAVEVER